MLLLCLSQRQSTAGISTGSVYQSATFRCLPLSLCVGLCFNHPVNYHVLQSPLLCRFRVRQPFHVIFLVRRLIASMTAVVVYLQVSGRTDVDYHFEGFRCCLCHQEARFSWDSHSDHRFCIPSSLAVVIDPVTAQHRITTATFRDCQSNSANTHPFSSSISLRLRSLLSSRTQHSSCAPNKTGHNTNRHIADPACDGHFSKMNVLKSCVPCGPNSVGRANASISFQNRVHKPLSGFQPVPRTSGLRSAKYRLLQPPPCPVYASPIVSADVVALTHPISLGKVSIQTAD